jgi:hypothetical protein
MPVQMIELEEVTMVEGSDDLLEIASAALQVGRFATGNPTAGSPESFSCC